MVAGGVRTDPPVLAKGRIGGLRLEATDGDFRTGDGTLVAGPTLALIMAMTGRRACQVRMRHRAIPSYREPFPS